MTSFAAPPRRAPGLVLVFALHLALLYAFLQTRPRPELPDAPRGPAIQWLHYAPATPRKPQAMPVPRPVKNSASMRRAAPISVPRPAPAPTATAEPAAETAAPPEVETALQARPGAADILAQAKRDVGKIDRELRKQFPQRGEQKFEDTAFKRMQQGFAEAYAAVPPKWYEASKIEEVGANEARGSRTYKITSALGTLCVTTRAGKNGETLIGMCPQ